MALSLYVPPPRSSRVSSVLVGCSVAMLVVYHAPRTGDGDGTQRYLEDTAKEFGGCTNFLHGDTPMGPNADGALVKLCVCACTVAGSLRLNERRTRQMLSLLWCVPCVLCCAASRARVLCRVVSCHASVWSCDWPGGWLCSLLCCICCRTIDEMR